jgi:hypothetical protein
MADKDKGYNFQGADIESFSRYLEETSKIPRMDEVQPN